MRRWKLQPFENVGANQTAIMPRIQQGEVFHGILLKLGGTAFTKAMIDQIKIKLGGKTIWDLTGSQLDTICSYLGFTANAAYLMIPFSEFNARTIWGEAIGAIDTATITYSNFSMEVKIGAATAPTLEAWAYTTPVKTVSQPGYIPMVRTMIPAVHNLGAAGKYALPIPLGSAAGANLKRLHHFHANITELNTKVNGTDLIDQGEIGVLQYEQNMLTRVTQAGHLVLDLLVRDNQSEAMPTIRADGKGVNNFEFYTTISAADTITTISDMYASVNAV